MAKKLFSLFFLISFFTFPLLGNTQITPGSLTNYPPSLAKDFYIWYFLKHAKLSSQEADALFDQAKYVNDKLFKAYAKKSDQPKIKQQLRCMNFGYKKILKSSDTSCIETALSTLKVAKMAPYQRTAIAKKIKEQMPDTYHWLDNIDKINPLKNDPKLFLKLFKEVGSGFRRIYYNADFSQKELESFADYEDFEKFIELVAIDKRMTYPRRALVKFRAIPKVSAQARFYIALIKITQGKMNDALEDLEFVATHDYFRMNRDKALFWSYLITKEAHFLESLHLSDDLNIYTIYASQALNKEFLGVYSLEKVDNNASVFKEDDPFIWSELAIQSKKMSAEDACDFLTHLDSEKNPSFYAYYLEKCTQYSLHPFVTPYSQELSDLSASKKALFYAIGRQESRLIAGGVSSMYALGMMQIMPYVSLSIAKQKKQKLDLPQMFNPQKNIAYAKHHLKYLYRKTTHPLLIAYAYNGGIGFLKKILKRGYFQSNAPFEPFLSMELLPYAETREYGKKVLANYVIYKELFDEPISLAHLLKTLK